MTYEIFLEETKHAFAQNPSVPMPTEEQIEKLWRLTDIMLAVNEQMNLTTITDRSQIVLKHYVDSLTVSKYIPQNAKIIDIGCGAGFPSLPLAICREDLQITALDSTAKRINYVNDTAQKLGLENLSAIAARAEDEAKKPEKRERYDLAVARAVADLPVLCELCLPFVKLGGRFIAMKAAKGDEEYSRSERAIKLCGGADAQIIEADITDNGTEYEKRRLIIVEKREKTPKIYPRNFAQISKKPL
ncbi:MAG: 16S rRNA (guanine(527)-N(7))-methyltransferase RsmG [Ruminococcaceae bacterium]|nr:16S rRNA (guanine(527)-N(7))-methyltransferase RsmG [Oscillospiraceae bacterium]